MSGWTNILDMTAKKDILVLGLPGSGKTTTCQSLNEKIVYAGGCIVDWDVTGYTESAYSRYPATENLNLILSQGNTPKGLGSRHRLWIPLSNPPIADEVPDYSILFTIDPKDLTYDDFKLFFTKLDGALRSTLYNIMKMRPDSLDKIMHYAKKDFMIETEEGSIVVKTNKIVREKIMDMCLRLQDHRFISSNPDTAFKPRHLKAGTYNTFALGHMSDEQKKFVIMNMLQQIVEYRKKHENTFPIYMYFREAHLLLPNYHHDEELQKTFIIKMKRLQKEKRHYGIQFIFDTQTPTSLHPEVRKLVNSLYVHCLTSPADIEWVRSFIPESEHVACMQELELKAEFMKTGISIRYNIGETNVELRPLPSFQLEPSNGVKYFEWVRQNIKSVKFVNIWDFLPPKTARICVVEKDSEGEYVPLEYEPEETESPVERPCLTRKEMDALRPKKDELLVIQGIMGGFNDIQKLESNIKFSDKEDANRRKIQRLLKSLRNKRWLEAERKGNVVVYTVNGETLRYFT